MIIPNSIVKLEYHPTTDVLHVSWPDFTDYELSQAQYSLDGIVEAIRNYDVKYLLLDTRRGAVKINEDLYREIKVSFFLALVRTRLVKLARVVSAETLRQQLMEHVIRETSFKVSVENFYDVEDALKWLTSK